MSEARGLNWLWRSAVAASLVKGVLCGVVAGVAIVSAYSLDGYGAMLGVILLVYSQALLAVAVGYLLAAFLVARRTLAWRLAERCSMRFSRSRSPGHSFRRG